MTAMTQPQQTAAALGWVALCLLLLGLALAAVQSSAPAAHAVSCPAPVAGKVGWL